MAIQKRRLGETGVEVTILGLGGEGVLRTFDREKEAYALVNRAVDLGINYFESARAYSGSESYYGLALQERRKDIFLASKAHARDKRGALAHLRETLGSMKTDHLDLWQVHDVRTIDEVDEIFGKEGAIEAFREAREKGQVRFIGVTGHHDPSIILKCLERFDFDTVLMPLNPAEPHYKSFIEYVLPAAVERQMGVIAMKVYFGGLASLIAQSGLAPFFRYALSYPVTTAVIGCDTIEQLEENVRFASSFEPMTEDEVSAMNHQFFPIAHRLSPYKPLR